MSRKAALRCFFAGAVSITCACAFDSEGYGPHHGDVADSSSDDGAAADDDGDAPITDDGANDGGGADDHGEVGGDAPGTTDPSGGDPTSDDGSAVDAGDDESTGPAAESEGGDGDVEPTCPDDTPMLLWADAADVGAPMQLIPTDANMAPEAAASAVAESGTVTFSIDFACPGEYAIWGLVWDYAPGAYGSDDPDSLYVGIGGPEETWRYGCQTGEVGSGLSWQRLNALQTQPCDAVPLAIEVAEAGTIELQFRNREAGTGSQVAGIAAIVVATDAAADPAELYTPY